MPNAYPPPPPPDSPYTAVVPPPPPSSESFWEVVIGVGVLIGITGVIVVVRWLYRQWRMRVRKRMVAAAVAALPTVQFPPAEGLSTECSFCLEEYSEGDELKMFPCRHLMHEDCASRWLTRRDWCPTCRGSVLQA